MAKQYKQLWRSSVYVNVELPDSYPDNPIDMTPEQQKEYKELRNLYPPTNSSNLEWVIEDCVVGADGFPVSYLIDFGD